MCVDKDGLVMNWVRERIGYVPDFGKCEALGLVAEDGAPLAGAVYHEYRPECGTVMISFAAISPRWATENTVRAFLAYPFQQLGVNKLRAAIIHTNERSLRLTGGVGFKREGTLSDEFGPGKHAVMFGMFSRYFWRRYGEGLEGHGQKQRIAA